MASNHSPAQILSGMGHDPTKFSNAKDYQKALLKAITADEVSTGKETTRSGILRKELKKSRIDARKVFNRGSQTQPDSTKKKTKATTDPVGGGSAIVKYIENNEKAITTLSNVVVNDSEEEKKKQKEKQARTFRQQETDSLKKEEGALEKFKDLGKKALLAPVKAVGNAIKGMLSQLMDVFAVLFTGWIVDKGMKFIEAWQSGDKDRMKQIGVNIIAGLGIVGGIVLAFNVGLMALPGLLATLAGSIVSIGGAILGFLISPPGLIALAIAAGVGGMILGAKALGTKLAGGKGFNEARTKQGELEDKMNDLGVHNGQVSVNGVMKDVMEFGSDEQKAAHMEHENEKKRLDGLKASMDKEIKEYKKGWKEEAMASKVEGEKVDWAHWNPIRDENVAKIKAKYNNKALNNGGTSSEPSEVKPSTTPKVEAKTKIEKSTPTPDLPKLKDPEPKVVVKPSKKKESAKVPLTSGTTTEVPSIASSDPNNFYTMYSRMQYNVVG